VDLDLHLHSSVSDGTVSPAGVVEAAVEARLDVIALTDHDTTAGVGAAIHATGGRPLEIIPALEVSSTWEGGEVHILGYFVDPEHPELVEHARWAGERRSARMRGMVERLQEQGVRVSYEDVEALAGQDRGSLARPHLARALAAAGYVASAGEAFDRFIGNEHDAYIPTRLLSPEDAIDLILRSGGIPVWAHPYTADLDSLLPRLVRAGLRGLEVYRPRNPGARVALLERTAASAGLLVTGGSDWHGPEGGPLGDFRVSSRDVHRFLEAGGL
jgi:3',5'-nucleoside bisphosphate phosphatase